MKNKIYYVIGVMSGTSLDGIDLCYVRFHFKQRWLFKILSTKTISYSKEWSERLSLAISQSITVIGDLNEDYTSYLGNIIKQFIKEKKISKLDMICSHGHTIFHDPENGITLQIGNLKKLAAIIEKKVICDFRVQDVMLGGQGAPLVPIGDELLFNNYDFCINLGGFANVSFSQNGKRIAFDICPVNIVLNYFVKELDVLFDNEGNIAKSGTVNNNLLKKLNDLSFYNQQPPKSLGLEWVQKYIFPLIDEFDLSTKDKLRTFVEHIAIQIAKTTNHSKNGRILFTGGGVFNKFLMERISKYNFNKVVVSEKTIVDYKEALIFGLLGILKLRNEVNCLSSVTGAKQDHSSGNIFIP